MAKVQLIEIAIARSGDKGNSSNIGVMARSQEAYEFLASELTADLVKNCFKAVCTGAVTRYELPNLRSLNFLLESSLGGGGSETLKADAQGKVYGPALLHLEMDVPDTVLRASKSTSQ